MRKGVPNSLYRPKNHCVRFRDYAEEQCQLCACAKTPGWCASIHIGSQELFGLFWIINEAAIYEVNQSQIKDCRSHDR